MLEVPGLYSPVLPPARTSLTGRTGNLAHMSHADCSRVMDHGCPQDQQDARREVSLVAGGSAELTAIRLPQIVPYSTFIGEKV